MLPTGCDRWACDSLRRSLQWARLHECVVRSRLTLLNAWAHADSYVLWRPSLNFEVMRAERACSRRSGSMSPAVVSEADGQRNGRGAARDEADA